MLKNRIITAALLLSAFAAILFAGPVAVAITGVAITGRIVFEFLSVALLPSRRGVEKGIFGDDVVLYTTLLSVPSVFLLALGLKAAMLVGVVVMMIVFLREAYLFESSAHEEPSKEILCALAIAAIYPCLFGTALVAVTIELARVFPLDFWRVILWFVALVILSDTGPYFGGKLMGNNKLSPRISPNKTVEGAMSGLVLTLAAAIPLAIYLKLEVSLLTISLVAIVISILSQSGDLIESWIKRVYEVKDMGQLLPGHGGVFDRVDSYIFCAPALFLLLI